MFLLESPGDRSLFASHTHTWSVRGDKYAEKWDFWSIWAPHSDSNGPVGVKFALVTLGYLRLKAPHMTSPHHHPDGNPDRKAHDNRVAVLGIAGMLLVAAIAVGVSQLGGENELIIDGAATNAPTTGAPETIGADTSTTTATPATTVADEPATTTSSSTTTTTDAPAPVIDTGTYELCPDETDPEPSAGMIKDGVMTLSGDVPTLEDAQRIVELAESILGADGVVDNYRICPTASDPNDGNIVIEEAVLFDTGSSVVKDEFTPLLDQGIALMAIRPAMTVTVLGHTDSIGSDESNAALSLARAEAVIAYFTGKGVDSARMTPIGVGELQPIDSNFTTDGRARNRRIEFQLTNLLSE